ncbi:receptor-interacting serine/threonine-protein kinase 4-like [Apteryx rowi]|uniref:receptor-interacting serine/threonine-protein kinase 4-like n=1 Tax=Apteryx rowi TaxID=308060 RepID=UPI000E1DEA32|nr:receptor-interacting serine/threonine-protein kinase 4-like [Apteryx rowi]
MCKDTLHSCIFKVTCLNPDDLLLFFSASFFLNTPVFSSISSLLPEKSKIFPPLPPLHTARSHGSSTVTAAGERWKAKLKQNRLSFVDKDVSLTTEVRIDEGAPSPEICFIHKVHDYPYTLKEEKQINPIPLETNASDQSRSLLQSWINCPSFSENISESVFSLDAAVEGQQNNSLVGDPQREKEVISDYWIANSHEKPAGEGSSHSVETDLCAETTKATSRRARQLRETSSRKCRDGVSSCHQILQETQQRISHNGNTTRNKAKDFEKIQKSTSKDKQDLEINICHGMITLNGNRKAEQTRRSERIKKKIRQEASIRNSVNPIFPISLSRINRKNIFGETLLHKAVADEDVDLVCSIIKAGGNVNAQDYAGWTALHEASVEGLYRIANELLKAGADVNARGSEQITPLQDAVKEGHYELAELLLWYGADPLLKDEMGRCALEEASDQSMRKLLKSYIAKSRRDSEEISAGEDAESMLSAQSLEDTNLHQMKECLLK